MAEMVHGEEDRAEKQDSTYAALRMSISSPTVMNMGDDRKNYVPDIDGRDEVSPSDGQGDAAR